MRRDYRLQQLSGLEFSRQGCCMLRTWETQGLTASTMQTFLWPTVFGCQVTAQLAQPSAEQMYS